MKKLFKKIKKVAKKVDEKRRIGGWKIGPRIKIYRREDDRPFHKR